VRYDILSERRADGYRQPNSSDVRKPCHADTGGKEAHFAFTSSPVTELIHSILRIARGRLRPCLVALCGRLLCGVCH
jgi:hypothetical protein